MSRLQNLINSLIEVIVDYYETQTQKDYSLEALLKMPNEELMSTLQTLINDATKVYKTRSNLLNYFFYEISTLKPVVDAPEPLNEIDCMAIHERLFKLITNIKTLLETSQSSTISVSYDNKSKDIYGFIRGAMGYWTLCNSGQLIQDKFINVLNLPVDNSVKTLNGFIVTMIDEHQTALQLPLLTKENKQLKEENTALREVSTQTQEQVSELQKKIQDLQEQKNILENQLQSLKNEQEKMSDELERLRIENSSLRNSSKLPRTHLPIHRFHPGLTLFSALNPVFPDPNNLSYSPPSPSSTTTE